MDVTCEMAENLNTYAESHLVHKVARYDMYLSAQDIKGDDVHLTNTGYRVFMDIVFHSVVTGYLQPKLRKDKAKRREQELELLQEAIRKKKGYSTKSANVVPTTRVNHAKRFDTTKSQGACLDGTTYMYVEVDDIYPTETHTSTCTSEPYEHYNVNQGSSDYTQQAEHNIYRGCMSQETLRADTCSDSDM